MAGGATNEKSRVFVCLFCFVFLWGGSFILFHLLLVFLKGEEN